MKAYEGTETMTTEMASYTIDEIKRIMRDSGSHWFDPDTMRFFGTRIGETVYCGPHGVYFVTSEKPPHGPREYAIRQFDPDRPSISTIGDFTGLTHVRFGNRRQAHARAKELAGRNPIETREPYTPVSDREQFAFTLRRELPSPMVTDFHLSSLLRKAKLHHRYCCMQCGTGEPNQDAQVKLADRQRPKLETQITKLCKAIGCKPVFQGDPRGCTVKLALPSGMTDDWGKTGLCVPQ